MQARRLSEWLPEPERLLESSAAEIGGILLRFCEAIPEPGRRRNVLRRDYIGGRDAVSDYPERYRDRITQCLLEAWQWLERHGYIVPEGNRGNHTISRDGKKLLAEHNDESLPMRPSLSNPSPIADTHASPKQELGMDVLISWSKPQSRELASALHRWIPRVLPGVTPWMSDKDIDKGTDWWLELKGLLTRAKMCIICVTTENVRSPWLYFETGAIAVKGEGVRVCPYLMGIGPHMLADGPLGKWQCTAATKEDTLSMIRSLNRALDKVKPHDEGLLEGNFEARWPEFEVELSRIRALETNAELDFVETDADQLAGKRLTSEARTLLAEATKDGNGLVLWIQSDAGVFVHTNGRTFGEGGPRDQAAWRQAVLDLRQQGLLESSDGKGEAFVVTDAGYKVAELLK